jgi:hypothetical protein
MNHNLIKLTAWNDCPHIASKIKDLITGLKAVKKQKQ